MRSSPGGGGHQGLAAVNSTRAVPHPVTGFQILQIPKPKAILQVLPLKPSGGFCLCSRQAGVASAAVWQVCLLQPYYWPQGLYMTHVTPCICNACTKKWAEHRSQPGNCTETLNQGGR